MGFFFSHNIQSSIFILNVNKTGKITKKFKNKNNFFSQLFIVLFEILKRQVLCLGIRI